jgi:hypothetical protein
VPAPAVPLARRCARARRAPRPLRPRRRARTRRVVPLACRALALARRAPRLAPRPRPCPVVSPATRRLARDETSKVIA